METETGPSDGPIEVDETYVGGKEKNEHGDKKMKLGRGPVGKAAVIGLKDRATGQVLATHISRTDADVLSGFANWNRTPDATIDSDDHAGYRSPGNHHAVKHSVGQYVDGQAHTQGIESFWALLKCGYHGTYHKMSGKHLDRYVQEFAGRHNLRERDTVVQMTALARSIYGKRLRFADLIAPVGRETGSDVL